MNSTPTTIFFFFTVPVAGICDHLHFRKRTVPSGVGRFAYLCRSLNSQDMASVGSLHSNLSLGRIFRTRVLDLGKVVAVTQHPSGHDPHRVRTYPILGQVCASWEPLPHTQQELKVCCVQAPWRRPEGSMGWVGTRCLLKALAASCVQASCCPEAGSWAWRGSVACPDRQEQGSLG